MLRTDNFCMQSVDFVDVTFINGVGFLLSYPENQLDMLSPVCSNLQPDIKTN